MKRKGSFSMVLITLLFFGLSFSVSGLIENSNLISITADSPITINSDADFITYGFPGNGSEINPYVIENLNITTSASDGIYISGTTKYFVIRNCHIDTANYGIRFSAPAPHTMSIINNTFTGNFHSIFGTAAYATIINNTIYENNYGISITGSGSSVINNTFRDMYSGVQCSNGDYHTIISNTMIRTGSGIRFFSSTFNTVINNTIENGRITIDAVSSVSEYYTNTFENNLVNNHPFELFANLEDFVFDDPSYGQLYFVNCSNLVITDMEYPFTRYFNMITCPNLIIRNNDFGESNSIIIDIENADFAQIENNVLLGKFRIDKSLQPIIRNNIVNGSVGNLAAIDIDLCDDAQIYNNTCTNGWNGLRVGIWNGDIYNNTCYNNDYGLWIGLCFDTEVFDNFCYNNNYGLHIVASNSVNASENLLTNNLISGLNIRNSEDIHAFQNNISYNGYNGLRLEGTGECIITENFVMHNIDFAIQAYDDCTDKRIFKNIFLGNKIGFNGQALDEGKNNTWYEETSKAGNHWSDWTGTGTYLINGSALSEDLYPTFDLDSDELLDLDELSIYNTDLFSNDTDLDGCDDKWEIENDLDPIVNDSYLDADSDGLTNLEEYQYHTDPNDVDSDDDSFSDMEEIDNGTDPNDPLSTPPPPQKSSYIFVSCILLLICTSIATHISRRKRLNWKS